MTQDEILAIWRTVSDEQLEVLDLFLQDCIDQQLEPLTDDRTEGEAVHVLRGRIGAFSDLRKALPENRDAALASQGES